MQVRTKQEMTRLLAAGAFGNTWPTWFSPEKFRTAKHDGMCTLRYMVPGSRFFRSTLTPEETPETWLGLLELGADPAMLYCQEFPIDFITWDQFQGELMQGPFGYHLRYFYGSEVLRTAMFSDKAVESDGLDALTRLQTHLWPASWADMEALFEHYPDSIVEFTATEHEMGTIPGRNCVVWETRNY